MPSLIPKPVDVAREALIVLLGAIIAAAVVGQLPGLRQWIKDQWGDAPR